MSKEHIQVKVCPRFRPFLKSDIESMGGEEKPKSCVAFHKNGKNFLIKNGSTEPPEYMFEKYLKATATQEEAYTYTQYGTEIVQRLTDGINCTVFSFGAEQTGKTYTMFGKNAVALNPNLGFASRVVRAIFDFIVNTSPPEIEFSVSFTSFEICGLENGEALMTDLLVDHDLANDSVAQLEVLVNDETNSVEIAGLHEEFVTSEVELFQSISKSLEKRSKDYSSLFFEIKLLQSDTNTKVTKEARLTIIDLDDESTSDPHKKVRPNGCKTFRQVTEAIHSESDTFDYFETTLRCLLFSRIFINTASFGFINLSQSSLPTIVDVHTVPNLNLGNLLSEMSSEVGVNYVNLEGVAEITQQTATTPNKPTQTASSSVVTTQAPPLPTKQEQQPSRPVTAKEEPADESPVSPSSPVQEEKGEISDALFKKVLTEKLELSEQLATLKTKVSELETNLQKEHEASVQMRKQASTAETSLSDLEKKFKQISELKDSLEQEKIRHDESLQKTNKEIQDLKEKLIQADSSKEDLNEKLTQKSNEINELKENAKKLETQKPTNSSPVLNSRFSVSSSANSGLDSSLSVKKMEIDAETVNVLKIQVEEYKKMYEEIGEKLTQAEKKSIDDEESNISKSISQIASDDPSHQLIEKMKNKNKLLMEQLNLAKRENLKTREKAAELALKNLDDKIYEYQQLFNQYQAVIEKSSRLSISASSSTTASLRSAFEDKGNSQKLKETVDDLTVKLNTSRKKNTELEIAKMKAQETEKMHKEQIDNLEKEIKKLKDESNKKQSSDNQEVEQLRKEIAALKESDENTKEQLKKIEQEREEVLQKYKKSKAYRKKTLSNLQQSQESNTLLLLQEREKVETLEREIKFLKKYTGVKIESFQQPKKGGDVIQPKKLDAQTSRSNSQIEKEKLSQRMSVTVNKKHLATLSDQLGQFDVSQPFVDRKSVIAQEDEVYARSPRPNILEKKFGVKPSSMNADKHGYLEKKGPKLNMYKKRYFRIEGFYVYYFNDEADKLDKQLGCIDMRQVTTIEMILEKSSKKRHVFRIEIPSRDYFLAAQSKEERDEWVDTLNQIKEKVRTK